MKINGNIRFWNNPERAKLQLGRSRHRMERALKKTGTVAGNWSKVICLNTGFVEMKKVVSA